MRGGLSYTKDYQSQLDFAIEKLTKRVKWYLIKLTPDTLNKLASLPVRFLEFKGYRFRSDAGSGESPRELLSRLENVRKKVEEAVKIASK